MAHFTKFKCHFSKTSCEFLLELLDLTANQGQWKTCRRRHKNSLFLHDSNSTTLAHLCWQTVVPKSYDNFSQINSENYNSHNHNRILWVEYFSDSLHFLIVIIYICVSLQISRQDVFYVNKNVRIITLNVFDIFIDKHALYIPLPYVCRLWLKKREMQRFFLHKTGKRM